MNLHNFPYFDPTKKSAKKKYYKFQRHSLLTVLHKKHAHNLFFVYFGSGASLERRVDKIKNSKSKIIL